MKHAPIRLVVLALAAAACSGGGGATPTTTTAAVTTSAAPTTMTATTAATPRTVAAPAGLGDSRYPELGNGGYDVAHYTIDLTYDPEADTISSLVTTTATATAPLPAFSFDFIGYEITDITVDGSEVGFERHGGKLTIIPPTPISQGQSFTVTIGYNGTPAGIESAALPFVIGWRTAPDGTTYVVAEPDGARSWIPVNDHPLDKATYTFRITVPDPLVAAANGSFVEEITDLGWSTWVWETTHPMASYLATVVIGDLEIVSDSAGTSRAGVPVRNVLPPGLAADPPAALLRQGEMIEFFSERFGPYPLEDYGVAVVDGFEAAIETQTLSIFGRFIVDSSGLLETVLVHELAHQWFGDSVSPTDWGDIWLSEGFATYAEWLWVEHEKGAAAYTATVTGNYRDMTRRADIPPPGSPPADDLFNAGVYIRGALVLHALRVEIGDDAFFTTLRTYATRYADGNAGTADFIAVAEETAGRQLDGLFNAWLYAKGLPDL